MKRSHLRNKFLRDRTEGNKNVYRKQRNYCVSLLRKERKDFFQKIDTKRTTDNKLFWKMVKPFFSAKKKDTGKITLIHNNELIDRPKDISEIFNNFFANVVKNLNIAIDETLLNDTSDCSDPVEKAIRKYENHPSILMISQKITKKNFSSKLVRKEKIMKELEKLGNKKASQCLDNIPTRIIKENTDLFSDFLYQNFNNTIASGRFSALLKNANITPVYKKDSRTDEKNYRPVSILPNLSKVYEKCMYEQISEYFEDFLSRYQCGLRKGFSSQHSFIFVHNIRFYIFLIQLFKWHLFVVVITIYIFLPFHSISLSLISY